MASQSLPFRIALLASLALNLVFVVTLALRFVHDRPPFGARLHDGPSLRVPPPHLIKRVLPEQRPLIEATFERHRPAIRQAIHGVRDARRDLRGIFGADVYDASAAQAAFARLREHEAAAAAEIHTMIGELAGQLDVGSRRKLLEAFPAPGERRHIRRRPPDSDDAAAEEAGPPHSPSPPPAG